MGADAPIPPFAMNGRRPEGRPAAASIPCNENNFLSKYFIQVIQRHHLRPRPRWGQGWRKGDNNPEKWLLKEKNKAIASRFFPLKKCGIISSDVHPSAGTGSRFPLQ